jgi:multimeric flavodoxin WrbA/putative sterol carrier protein
VWETDVFLKINRMMTAVWAGLFALSGLISLIPTWIDLGPSWAAHIFVALPPILMLGLGLPFNKWYPSHYQRRLGLKPVSRDQVRDTNDSDRTEGRESIEASATGKALNSSPARGQMEERDMPHKLKIAAVNGSPHDGFGNTSQMLQMIRGHLVADSFDFEEILLCRHDIKYCVGCAFCLEKGACWINDDHRSIAAKLLEADAIILASPVYFFHVTAQMKTFLDRSLCLAHRPRPSWKPGLAVSVSAGYGETAVAAYLGSVTRTFGAFSVGSLTAIAVNPGQFLGKAAVEARAAELARDLVRAVREKRRYPASDMDLVFWQFMGRLVRSNKEFMRADDEHWQKHELYDSFENYIDQRKTMVDYNPELRKAWIEEMIATQKGRSQTAPGERPEVQELGPHAVNTVRELLEIMPGGLNPEAASGLNAVYQFEISGDEEFTAHLEIAEQTCTFHEGPAQSPDVIINAPSQVWLAVARGELDGQQAFMAGKYKVEGNISLLIKLRSLFGG